MSSLLCSESSEPTTTPVVDPDTRYRKCRPSGKKDGRRCAASPLCSVVTTLASPPAAATRESGPVVAANTITPSWFHVPPRGASSVLQTVRGGPPPTAIFLSLASAKNAIQRLSGDQNGSVAFSVPASGCATSESTGRTHNSSLPVVSTKLRTSHRPSGEMVPLLNPTDDGGPVPGRL